MSALDRVKRDVVYAVRVLGRTPAVTSILIVTLAVGIGANTAVFSILEAVLLRPLPYAHPDRLVAIWDGHVREPNLAKVFASSDDFDTWRAHNTSFEQLGALTWAIGGGAFKFHGQTRSVLALPASIDLFGVLGVQPSLGRTFDASDAGTCAIVLSNAFWRQSLGGDPRAVGQGATLDDRSCTVVGVMPAGFQFYPVAAEMWSLMPTSGDARPANVGVFGRLKRGVTVAAARAELLSLHRSTVGSAEHREMFAPTVYPLQEEFIWLAGRNLRATLIVFFAAVAGVLLIACVNVANMLFARAVSRQREFAVRAAIGAGAWPLIRQQLAEAFILSFAGATAGIAIAIAAIRWFRAANPVELPAGSIVAVDARVLMFTAALIGVTTMVCGLAPAWAAARMDIIRALKASGPTGSDARGRRRLGGALVIFEIACSVVLLIGAAMLVDSVGRLGAAPLGFDPEGLFTVAVRPARVKYSAADRRIQLYDRLATALGPVTNGNGVAFSATLAGRGVNVLAVQGRALPPPNLAVPDVTQNVVSPNYFHVLRVPLRQGRSFDDRDRDGAEQVAIVNEALVRQYFTASNPVGQRVRYGTAADSPWLTIVGVVGNQKSMDLYREMSWAESPALYRPLRQSIPPSVVAHLRAGGAHDLGTTVRRIVSSIDSDVATGEVEPVRDGIARTLAYPRFRAVLTGGFAGIALLLAAIGLYGVLAQVVAQRTPEIGIRLALGAQRRSVLLLVFTQGAWLVGLGLVAGSIAVAWIRPVMRAMLTDIHPSASFVVLGVIVMFLLTAALAMYVPARRATRISPLLALRGE